MESKKLTTEKALEQAAQEFLKEAFDMDLEIPVKINGRLKVVYGRYKYFMYSREPIQIEISKEYITYCSDEEILGVLKHECVHYALHQLGKPSNDGDKFFEETLSAFGIPATGTIDHKGLMHIYECIECKSVYRRLRKVARGGRCKCKKGGGQLDYKGKHFVDYGELKRNNESG